MDTGSLPSAMKKKQVVFRDSYVETAPANVISPTEKASQRTKLNNLLDNSRRILYETSAVFPFDFFPDRLVIDENKIDIIHGVFFFSSSVFSILLTDVKNAFITYNPLFATLNIEVTSFERNSERIKYLKKGDAQKAHRIIMGLAACKKGGVDVANFRREELLPKIEEIGMTQAN